jgi:hypothetical protein
MKISGFTFASNADSLYYPVQESIRSILPICDEFVIALGKGNEGDRTRELIESIADPRIIIVDTVWKDKEEVPHDHIFRQQANIALGRCTGDWCFHLQCDEVIHERDLPFIRKQCGDLCENTEVEGMLLNWKHFWGDYDHFIINHRWFNQEVRIIRNGIGIESFGDSQSFRRNGQKLKVVLMNAEIFHYSYVRPPRVMRRKQIAAHAIYNGRKAADAITDASLPWDYGSLGKLPRFTGTHPAVMSERIRQMDWRDQLQYAGKSRITHKHDQLRYKIVTFIEQKLLGGMRIGGYKNYIVLKGRKS